MTVSAKEEDMKPKYSCEIRLGEIPVCFRLKFPEAWRFFCESGGEVCRENADSAEEILVSESEWEYFRGKGIRFDGLSEASLLTAFASDYLIPHNAFIIHAVAFRFQGKAWLITGEPGAGKSTQIRNLQDLYPEDFQIICGDRPVVRFTQEEITVYPSPWNGKEGWHGAEAAQLEGIICLKRGEANAVTSLRPNQAVVPVYSAIIQTATRESDILKVAELETRMLETCNIYNLESNTVPQSTKLLFDHVFRERL